MQSTHEIISEYGDDGNPRCRAREIAPGKLMVQFQDCYLARRFQVSCHKYVRAPFEGNGGCPPLFFVRGKSLKWLKCWLEQNKND
jgi:hypothetical protein